MWYKVFIRRCLVLCGYGTVQGAVVGGTGVDQLLRRAVIGHGFRRRGCRGIISLVHGQRRGGFRPCRVSVRRGGADLDGERAALRDETHTSIAITSACVLTSAQATASSNGNMVFRCGAVIPTAMLFTLHNICYRIPRKLASGAVAYSLPDECFHTTM